MRKTVTGRGLKCMEHSRTKQSSCGLPWQLHYFVLLAFIN